MEQSVAAPGRTQDRLVLASKIDFSFSLEQAGE